ncbi:hypothetical protein [Kordiimonas sp.]|uniref:hypothetical protein n=1 Tax=Kordiimonas sp. TaxID=1970157 RepID=UPI003A8E3D0E
MTTHLIPSVEMDQAASLHVYAPTRNAEFQYVYRAAKGIYWEQENGYFYMKDQGAWDAVKVFRHIVDTIADELGLTLVCSSDTKFVGLTDQVVEVLLSSDSASNR